uniref:Uncharacterized protein n=1 Tax=Marseillevirus sp. TaxID=2809551 RepID=A0AA96EL98_9VIRU|nr:hypothetical protein MarDSR_411 [Marseillevirus sp.]
MFGEYFICKLWENPIREKKLRDELWKNPIREKKLRDELWENPIREKKRRAFTSNTNMLFMCLFLSIRCA